MPSNQNAPTGQIWGVQSVRTFTLTDDEQAMREAYVDCLLGFARGIREGKPLLRLLEVSLDIQDDLGARVRMRGFETDADYDELVQHREERVRQNALAGTTGAEDGEGGGEEDGAAMVQVPKVIWDRIQQYLTELDAEGR